MQRMLWVAIRSIAADRDIDDADVVPSRVFHQPVKPAQDVFWGGHSGYFTDPDGHYWEVAWNALNPLDQDGFMRLDPQSGAP